MGYIKELEKIVDATIEANRSLIEDRGPKVFGLFMSMIMKEVRGKAKAALVSELIKRRLEQIEKG